MKRFVIENKKIRLVVDRQGRLVSLQNKDTGTEIIRHPEVAEAWRLVIPTGKHTLAFVYGSGQQPKNIRVERQGQIQRLTINYSGLVVEGRKERIGADFSFELADGSPEIQATVKLENDGNKPIDEVEFPVVGGMSGFKPGKKIELINIDCSGGAFNGDVLNNGLPITGREADQFVCEHETAMWEDKERGALGLVFMEDSEGLYAGYHPDKPGDFGFKLERYPKNVPNAPCHDYPKETPRWLRLWGIHIARLQPGRKWESGAVTLMPYKGNWHAAVIHPAQNYIANIEIAPRPKWMDNFVGWTEIIGKLYTGEVFYDFNSCAKRVTADKKVTGLDLLFYYGHTNLGAEGADFDQSPARDMGGEKGFAEMLKDLHRNGIRIMLLDHFHRYVNRDVPEYKKYRLEKYALRNREGGLCITHWWKETLLSCRRLEGPTPVWIEMCLACPEWQEFYLDHVRKMVERGVDALELDCFSSGICWSRDHGHEPGANVNVQKIAFMRKVREMTRMMNPDFALFFETMEPRTASVSDGWYSSRYGSEHGRIPRFMFPVIRQQTVRVGNYAYDAVNRAVQLCIGVNTEIWGLRKTALEGCPELARYIGKITRFRRKYAEIMIRGTFRDTLGARVTGDVFHSVIEGPNNTRALVLRNPHNETVKVKPVFNSNKPRRNFLIWSPQAGEKKANSWPRQLILPARGLAVLLDLD